jgi:hypothetical protein
VNKGTALYTSSFSGSLPNIPLTAISGTSILTCQSSTIVDNGPSALSFTSTGTPVATTNAGAVSTYSNTEPFVRYFIAGGGSGGGGGNEGISNDVNTAGGGIQWNSANGVSLIGTAGANYPGDGGGTGGGGGGLYGGAGQSIPTGLSSGGGNYINPSYAVNSYFSNYFDGTGDSLSTSYNSAFAFPGDFTIECWLNWSAHGSYGGIVGCADTNTSQAISAGWFLDFNATNNTLQFEGQGGVSIVTTNTIPANQWNHIAVVRSGSTITHYLNGVSNGSGTSSQSFNGVSTSLFVGKDRGSASYITGYISNLRVVKGTALYTGAFTPSTTPLAAISGTSVLTCQSSRFVDNSTNNFTITRNGDVIVREIHPFNIPTGNAELGGGIGFATGSFSLPANVNFFGYTSAGSGGTFGNNTNPGANGTVVIRYTGYQKAIGGTVDYDNGYTIHTYDSPGTFVLQ